MVIVNVLGIPGQPFAVIETVMVAVTGTLELLIAVNGGMVPVPAAARPIRGLSFIQLKVAPLTAVAKVIVFVVTPVQYIWSAGWVIAGNGLTVIVNTFAGLEHPLALAITVIVAVTGCVVLLIAVNDGILPEPLAAKPISVLSFVQL